MPKPKNHIKTSVALRYWPGLPAPFLVAKARGFQAERLLQIADTYNIPIVEHEALAEIAYTIDVGAFIPESCYEVLAYIFAFIKKIEENETTYIDT